MSARPIILKRFDRSGATALEFAIVCPIFFMMLIGIVHAGLLMFSAGQLRYAVQTAARCASVQAASCKTAANIEAYAASKYVAPFAKPTFAYAADACGNSLTAKVDFQFDVILYKRLIPLTANACLP